MKTTLSFTDHHHRFLTQRVEDGVFASRSAAVAAALEQMIRDEEERELRLGALADEVRSRLRAPPSDYVAEDDAFAAARARLDASREG